MADWDDEDFEPGDFSVKQSDKWDGEDEEDKDVKENWDDEEEDSGKTASTENKTEKPPEATVKKRKTLKQALQEKEEKRKETLLKREENQQDSKEQESEPLTKEEELAEKLRQKKLVEESDLELAKQAFGVKDDIGSKSIDEMNPSTKEEFVELSSLLVEKLSHYESCGEYVSFLEMLFRDLCASLEADDVKRLGSTINILSSEKLKAQKAKKGKKTVKKATLSGASAKSGRKDDLDAFGTGTYDYRDDFDDFM